MPNFDVLAKSWHKYKHPWTPNKKNITYLSPFFETKKKVCLLGSTKEVRRLSKTRGVFLDVYDMSSEMYKINSVGNEKEEFRKENWFNINNKKYDLIFGDLILFLFNKEDQLKLINILKSNLAPNGKIILRTGGMKKNKNISDFITYLINTKVIDYQKINKICYELKIGENMQSEEMLTILKKYNKNAYTFLHQNFLDLIPYGKLKIEEINSDIKYTTIYQENFHLSYENIVEIS